MPFRCFNCDKLCDTQDIACDQPTACHIQEVAVTHFASAKGIGQLVGRSSQVFRGPDESIRDPDGLYLWCMDSSPHPRYSPIEGSVTCLQCIQNIIQAQKE